MTRLRGIASIIVVTAFMAGCSGSGGYGAYGGAPASAALPSAASVPAVVGPSTAAATPAGASAAPVGSTSGGGKYDYGIGAGAGASAAAATSGGAAASGSVLLSGFAFKPAEISVAAGSTIAFTNRDSVKHVLVEGQNGTPTSAGAPQSTVTPGQTVSIPFATAGAATITCTIHPSMNLAVTVAP